MANIKGKYIVVEGANATGKGLVVKLIKEKIFPDAALVKEPDWDTPSGRVMTYNRFRPDAKPIDDVLLIKEQILKCKDEDERKGLEEILKKMEKNEVNDIERVQTLLFATNRLPILKKVKKFIDGGKTVISDRSFFSSIADRSMYMPMQEIIDANRRAFGADYLIVLSVPLEIIKQRREQKTEGGRYVGDEQLAHQIKIYENIGRIIDKLHPGMRPKKYRIIDNSGLPEKTLEEVRKFVTKN